MKISISPPPDSSRHWRPVLALLHPLADRSLSFGGFEVGMANGIGRHGVRLRAVTEGKQRG